MNNLFFTTLCLVLLYYFFFYLPNQKPTANLPFKQNQATQTEPEIAIIDPGPEKDAQIESLKEANQKLLAEVNEDKKLFQQLVKEMQELGEKIN